MPERAQGEGRASGYRDAAASSHIPCLSASLGSDKCELQWGTRGTHMPQQPPLLAAEVSGLGGGIFFALSGPTQLHGAGLRQRCTGCRAMALLSPTAPLSHLPQSGTEQPGSRNHLNLFWWEAKVLPVLQPTKLWTESWSVQQPRTTSRPRLCTPPPASSMPPV